jgi:hypothetical protein
MTLIRENNIWSTDLLALRFAVLSFVYNMYKKKGHEESVRVGLDSNCLLREKLYVND